MRNRLLMAFAAAALLVPGMAAAQSADITAQAVVLAPLAVTTGDPLDFGDVIPGFSKAVNPLTDAGRGSFNLAGGSGLEVELDFGTLPSELVSGANTLPISFAGNYAASGEAADGTGAVLFDPTAGPATDVLSAAGDLFVFVGGEVTPAVNQAAGTYSAVVTLTAAYTGN